MDKCRYITSGSCALTGNICTYPYCKHCNEPKRAIKYTYSYNPFTDVTRISIIDNRGNKFLTVEIYGQLPPVTIKGYAIDMCKILIDKGVL